MKKLLFISLFLLIPVVNSEEDKNYCYLNEREKNPMYRAITILSLCPAGNTMYWRANIDSTQIGELAWLLCDYRFTVKTGATSTCIRKNDETADTENFLFLLNKYDPR